MKRLIIALLITAIAIFSFACSKKDINQLTTAPRQSSTTSLESKPTTAAYYYKYFLSDNPIDNYYGGGPGTVHVNERFAEYWGKEVEHTFELLCELLDENEIKKLKEEQQLWLDFMNSPDLDEALYERVKVEAEKKEYGDYGIDSPSLQRLIEVRRRAYELMERHYQLTGKVTFVFEGPDEDAIVVPHAPPVIVETTGSHKN